MNYQMPLFPFDLPTGDVDPSDREREFFPTQPEIADFGVRYLLPDWNHPRLIDAGCGNGVWGRAIHARFKHAISVGVDLPGFGHRRPYSLYRGGDYRLLARLWLSRPGIRFDGGTGNPPFSLGVEFILLTLPLLKPGGVLVQYLPLAFLCSQTRELAFWPLVPLRYLVPLARRPSHTGNSRTAQNTEYGLFVFQKGYQGLPTLLPPLDWKYPRRWRGHGYTLFPDVWAHAA